MHSFSRVLTHGKSKLETSNAIENSIDLNDIVHGHSGLLFCKQFFYQIKLFTSLF